MRKGLIILFLLLVVTFGIIGLRQDGPNHDVKIKDEGVATIVDF
ncbi:hypothetical protein [Amphibacillus cookii]|nr:hypothetical protein [Amphibacillus cookii]MBM7540899.1 hypothetical protein [Amphibacillus cookii]